MTAPRSSGLGWLPGGDIRVRTTRFVIRSLKPDEVDDTVVAWLNDPVLNRYMGPVSLSSTVEQIREMIRRGHDNRDRDYIAIRHQDRAIGLLWVDAAAGDRRATTHHLLGDRRWWGKGVIHEARAWLIEALFRAKYEKVCGMPQARNLAAVRTYEEQGFTLEGLLRAHTRDREGNRHDVCRYGMLPGDWDFDRARRAPEPVLRRQAALAARAARAAAADPSSRGRE